MTVIRATLTGEGRTDRLLMFHIRWLLEQHSAVRVELVWADARAGESRDVRSRAVAAIEDQPCDLLFVHRDTDGRTLTDVEMELAAATSALGCDAVFVIPVRETESWLAFNGELVALAAGNPSGARKIRMLTAGQTERRADVKEWLADQLTTAACVSGRRRKEFRAKMTEHMYRIAELATDFSQLREWRSFRETERRLSERLRERGWARA